MAAAVAQAAGVAQPRLPAGDIDWAGFAALTRRHRVGSLVHRSGLLPDLGAPADTVADVAAQARQTAARALGQLAVLAEVTAALRAAGVDVLVFKGLPLADHAYRDPAARDAGDLDLLVDPRQAAQAVRVLRALGFQTSAQPGCPPPDQVERMLATVGGLPAVSELPLLRGGVCIDLHWRLFPNGWLLPVEPGWLREPEIARLGPVTLPVLPAEHHWRLVARHGARSNWFRLKWLADVPALLTRDPALAQVSVGTRDPAVAGALLLAERVFGQFLADDVRRWAAGVPGSGFFERRGLSHLVAPEHPRITPGRIGSELRFRMLLGTGRRYRRHEVRRLLIEAGRWQLTPDPGPGRLAAGLLSGLLRQVRRGAGTPPAALVRVPSGCRALAGRWPLRQAVTYGRLPRWRRRRLAEAAAELVRACVEVRLRRPDRVLRLLGELDPAPVPAADGGPAGAPTGVSVAAGVSAAAGVSVAAGVGADRPAASAEAPRDAAGSGPIDPVREAAGSGPVDPVREAARLGQDVALVARHLPGQPTCLRQALAVARMLRRRGVTARVHLGAARAGALSAHAWVTVDGLVVAGRAGRGGHTALASFVSRPAAGRQPGSRR